MANALSGIVKDATNTPVSGRLVRAYREDTGALIGSDTSNAYAAEVAADANWADVVLALKFDSDFTDLTSSHTVTATNAVISSVQSKFGGSSAYFDGTGDYLSVPNSSDFLILWGTDSTIDFWVYPTNIAGTGTIVSMWGAAETRLFAVWVDNGKIVLNYSTNGINWYQATSSDAAIAGDVWSHVELSLASGTLKIFVNGVSVFSGSVSGTDTCNQPLIIGGTGNNGGTPTYPFAGYIDDFRITKGVARHTAAFDAPTTEFATAGSAGSVLGSFAIDTGSVTTECTLVFSGESAYNSLVISGVTPVTT